MSMEVTVPSKRIYTILCPDKGNEIMFDVVITILLLRSPANEVLDNTQPLPRSHFL